MPRPVRMSALLAALGVLVSCSHGTEAATPTTASARAQDPR